MDSNVTDSEQTIAKRNLNEVDKESQDASSKKKYKTLSEIFEHIVDNRYELSESQLKNRIASLKDVTKIKEIKRRVTIVDKKCVDRCLEIIKAKVASEAIPGVSIAISCAGCTIYSGGIGFSDVENSVECSSDTVMRIASISKAITASTICARLIESGDLNIDDSIYNYISEDLFPKPVFENVQYDITVKQLLNHTSGIKHYATDLLEYSRPVCSEGSLTLVQNDNQYDRKEIFQRHTYRNVFESLDMFKNEPLQSKPGKFHYTTYGFTLLSAILEKVIEKSWDRLMSEESAKQSSEDASQNLSVESSTELKTNQQPRKATDEQSLKASAETFENKASPVSNSASKSAELVGLVEQPCHKYGDVWTVEKPNEKLLNALEAFVNQFKSKKPGTSKQFEDVWIHILREEWGMSSTHLDHDEPLILHRARYYMRNPSNKALINAPYTDNSYKWAGGGLLSTCNNLILFANHLLNSYKGRHNSPLKKETIDLLWTAPEDRHYGLGFQIITRDSCYLQEGKFWNKAIFHTGAALGASSIIYILPESEVVIAILANLYHVDLRPSAARIAEIVEEVVLETGLEESHSSNKFSLQEFLKTK